MQPASTGMRYTVIIGAALTANCPSLRIWRGRAVLRNRLYRLFPHAEQFRDLRRRLAGMMVSSRTSARHRPALGSVSEKVIRIALSSVHQHYRAPLTLHGR